MGEALLVRRGGGSKVTIDGEKVKGELNLISEKLNAVFNTEVKYDTYGYRGIVVLNDEVYIFCNNNGKDLYKWNGTTFVYVSTLPFTPNYRFYAVVLNGEIHVLCNTNHYKWNGTTWTSVSTLPVGLNVYGINVVVLNREIHMLIGLSHYKWNGSEWSSEDDIPVYFSSSFVSTIVLNGTIYYLGNIAVSTTSYGRLLILQEKAYSISA